MEGRCFVLQPSSFSQEISRCFRQVFTQLACIFLTLGYFVLDLKMKSFSLLEKMNMDLSRRIHGETESMCCATYRIGVMIKEKANGA